MSTILRPDIFIQDLDGRPVAIVEIKNYRELTRDIAIELRDTFLGYGYAVQAPYYLLLSQDRGFLWKDANKEYSTNSLQEFDMHNVVARYFPSLQPTDRLRGAELTLIVLRWLSDLAEGWQ